MWLIIELLTAKINQLVKHEQDLRLMILVLSNALH